MQNTIAFPIGERTVHSQYIPHFDEEGSVIGFFSLITDITDIKNKQNLLEEAVKEKQILLKEVHHRVKNNLNIIKGLIEIHKMNHESTEDLTDITNQISAIASFHDKLYHSGGLSAIDLENYLRDLIFQIIQTYGICENCAQLDLSLQGITCEADIAINCGLVINELVGNSVKHAFSDEDEDQFRLSMSLKNDHIHLQYFDSGENIEQTPLANTEDGGLSLMQSIITGNLRGNITTGTDHNGNFRTSIIIPAT